MKVFHCDHCGQLVYFENTSCLNCGHTLAYVPDLGDVCSLEVGSDGLWRSPNASDSDKAWKLCTNYEVENVCNWAVASDDPQGYCLSCRLTRVIPNLKAPGSRDAWLKLETAKRRLIYTLLQLRLPLMSRAEDPRRGVAFDFLADEATTGNVYLSGHDRGLITINIAEADDAERERRRNMLGEPYRTLLGHFRHEIGHYYWDRLVLEGGHQMRFRELFGDETQDYGLALKRHYDHGPVADWQLQYISAYASSHPWEDWAETWAHYMHMNDVLQMAAWSGLSLKPQDRAIPAVSRNVLVRGEQGAFDRMIEAWFPLTHLINNLNRGLGLPDGYPFVMSQSVIDKLRFIHEIVTNWNSSEIADAAGISRQTSGASLN